MVIHILAVGEVCISLAYPRTERDRIVAQDLMLKGQYGAGSIVKQ